MIAIFLLILSAKTDYKPPLDNPTEDPNAIPQSVVKLENIDYEAELLLSPGDIFGNLLDVPVSTESIFDGWYDETGRRVLFSTEAPTNDSSITAHWSETQTTIRLPVLAFEDFDGNSPTNTSSDFYPISEFTKLLDYLASNDYYFPTWKEISSFINKQANLPAKSIVLTTNRYNRRIIDEIYPLLTKYHIPMTSFLITDSAVTDYDTSNIPATMPGPYLLGRSQGFQLASVYFNNLPNTSFWSTSKMVQDLETSATTLGVREVFAYPQGLTNPSINQALVDTGFALAVTQSEGFVTVDSDPLSLPRFVIEASQNSTYIIDNIVQPALD
jgi:hypothetical protein